MFEQVPSVLASLVSGTSLLYLFLGVLIGLFFGAVPGLGGSQVLALLLPLTLVMEPAHALILLLAASSATSQGGAVSAILLNTPGTAANTASTFDGYEMTKRGEGARALGAAASAGIIGSVVGIVILISVLPLGRWIVLQFSYAEYFALAVFGLAAVALVSTASSPLRALASGLAGLLVATAGISVTTGDLRYTFGSTYLYEGLGLIPVLIGLFALPEALRLFGLAGSQLGQSGTRAKSGGALGQALSGAASTMRHWSIGLRAAMIGTAVGVVPGVGGTVSNFLAYGWAARSVGDKGTFGKGDIRGVIAPEAANNAKEGGALLPTLIFGIPGSVETAVLLGALTVHGLQPGPQMMLETPDLVLLLVLVGVIGNILASVGSFGLVPVASGLARMPHRLLGTLLLTTALAGAYLTQSGIAADAVVTLLFGVAGLMLVNGGYSRVMFTIGFVLGPMMERSLFQTLQVSGGTAFFTQPLSLVLLLLTAVLLLLPFRHLYRRRKADQATVAEKNARSDTAEQIPAKRPVLGVDIAMIAVFAFGVIAIMDVDDLRSRTLPQAYALLGLILVLAAVWAALRARRKEGKEQDSEDTVTEQQGEPTGSTGSPGTTTTVLTDTVSVVEAVPATEMVVPAVTDSAPPEAGTAARGRFGSTVWLQSFGVLAGAIFCFLILIPVPLWMAMAVVSTGLGLVVGVRPRVVLVASAALTGTLWLLTTFVLGLTL